MIAELALAAALTIAQMGGSDDPTPYTVDGSGITLPAGQVFEDNGHVNVMTITGSFGLHFEAKCVVRTDAECAGARHAAAQFIGTGFIPWSAFGIAGCDSVVWVQLAQFNEHFGEGGQASVKVVPCVGTPTPEPTPDPTPDPEPTPTPDPTPEPTPDPTNTPVETPQPSDIPGASSLPDTGGPDWVLFIPLAGLLICLGVAIKRRPDLNRGNDS